MRLMLLIALTFLGCSYAQSAEISQEHGEAFRASTVHIDGKQNPEQVPFFFRMQLLFERFQTHDDASRLAPLVSSADLAVLTTYAAGHSEAQKVEEVVSKREWLAVADRAESMNAGELAVAMKDVSLASEKRQAARYRAVLDKLSPAGRTTVQKYAFEKVRPQVVRDDPVLLANIQPELYKSQIIGSREFVRAGTIPAMLISREP